LRRDGYDIAAQNMSKSASSIATGAGGSGSGFIVHPDGYILTCGHVVAPTRDEDALHRELLHNGAVAVLLDHFSLEDLRSLQSKDVLQRYLDLFASDATLEKIEIVNEVELSNGEKLPFTIVRFSPPLSERGTDLAIVKIARRNLPTLPLADSELVHVGQPIA